MAKLYDKLFVPELYSAVRPYEFIVGILRCIRTTTTRLIGLLGLSLSTMPTRPYYKHIDVHVDQIKTNKTNGTISYTVKLPAANIDVIGCMQEEPGILGRDFICEGDIYTFTRNHPTAYGTVTSDVSGNVLTLVCAGGDFHDDLNPLSLPYAGCVDAATSDAIRDSIYNNAPLGITTRLLEAVAGARLSTETVDTVWTEGDYTVGITESGKLVYAPGDSGIQLYSGATIDTTAVTDPLTDIIYVKLTGGHDIIKQGANALVDHPHILEDFPDLPVNNGNFSGVDVLTRLVADGYAFYHWSAISKPGDYLALARYQANPGKAAVSISAGVKNSTSVSYTSTSSKFKPVQWTLSSKARAYNYI